MNTLIMQHQQLTDAIAELPVEILPELANFIEYLRFKIKTPQVDTIVKTPTDSGFLQAITGLGASYEDDISERDEEILTNEIDTIQGWNLRDNSL